MLHSEIAEKEYLKIEKDFCDKYPQVDNEGIYIEIYDPNIIMGLSQSGMFVKIFPQWVSDLSQHVGKECDEGVFKGFCFSFMDYYYIIEKDGKKIYYSAVGKIEFKEKDEQLKNDKYEKEIENE